MMPYTCLAALCAAPAFAEPAHVSRLKAAEAVLAEIMEVSDRAIPQELLDRSHCAVIVPELKKGAFFFGGKYGRGFLSCRKGGRRRVDSARRGAH